MEIANDTDRKKQKKRMTRKNANVSCTTFNILAPKYKRMSSEEFWIENEELVDMYEHKLRNHGYDLYTVERPNNRGDGLLTAVRKDHFRVLKYRELQFDDFGDRVAQLLHVQSVSPFWQSQGRDIQQETLVVNTHLMFPHNSDFCPVRLRQARTILEHLESYKEECRLPPVPIILCGDWNGSKRGRVYKFLRSEGFVSSYDTVHSDANAPKWVSHRNHHGNICGVDFIWLLNPNNHCKSTEQSVVPAVCRQSDHGKWSTTHCSENLELTVGFDVKSAFLFPPEVERGIWPENYALSDHAPLTVVFSPVRL